MSSEKPEGGTNPHLIRANDRAKVPGGPVSHPLNPRSEVHCTLLSRATGLSRVGVNLLRVPPGKESFAYHRHECEEEFLYILSGRGVAEIGDEEVEVGPGDFLGFPAPSVAHHLRNPFDEELVYLSGGESKQLEVADFPRHGKSLVRRGEKMAFVESSAFGGLWVEKGKDEGAT
ncbi:cupin domain-containing protein [Chondromyces apiculatus]|uniref:Cupin domain protein n=1 Tax=Chondromyces apiculatus DSM 436 TaxID=1192034 RepID=A0A017SU75_9BACT|nr:cupin domain-containing protein [Chondromyces apiculatus]EYF00145.1 cupin domain protein [Chondromyces apiculatus DSM 436]